MKTFVEIEKEISLFCEKYNFTKWKIKDTHCIKLKGYINLKDPENGYCFDSFYVAYYLDLERYYNAKGEKFSYPEKLPKVVLLNHLELKTEDFHINSKTGECCLAPDVECCCVLSKDYNLFDFTEKLVVSFFATLFYKTKMGEWPYGDYAHYEEGLLEYYSLKLGVQKDFVVAGLEILVGRNKIGRNEVCFCNSGKKYKKCHREVIEGIQCKVDKRYLENNLELLLGK